MRYFLRLYKVECSICGGQMFTNDDVHFDHIHGEAMGGPHELSNLRLVHAACNLKKAGREVRALAKIDRITGKTKNKPKKKIPSRPFRR